MLFVWYVWQKEEHYFLFLLCMVWVWLRNLAIPSLTYIASSRHAVSAFVISRVRIPYTIYKTPQTTHAKFILHHDLFSWITLRSLQVVIRSSQNVNLNRKWLYWPYYLCATSSTGSKHRWISMNNWCWVMQAHQYSTPMWNRWRRTLVLLGHCATNRATSRAGNTAE